MGLGLKVDDKTSLGSTGMIPRASSSLGEKRRLIKDAGWKASKRLVINAG